ncbi:MAG: acyltransferase [Sphingomonas phyllosphaerae]|uniref:acyltransferase family protein n=1 Tax=Sphingomonas phyllosphaerae TaxID=257003 RepID=UPI002FFCC330
MPEPSRAPRPRPLLTNLQYVRAVAAYLVVLYHARLLTSLGQSLPLEFGRAGVDIFFVISGFIIQHVAARDDVGRPGAFMVKRLIRIAPLYWLLTLLIGLGGPLIPALASKAGIPDADLVVRSLFFVPYFDGVGEIHPVLFVGWTLNYEMFFYVLFAAGLMIRGTLVRLIVLSMVLLALVAIGFVVDPRSAPGITYTNPLLLEFGAGLWLHSLWQRALHQHVGARGRLAAKLVMTGAALALVSGGILWPTLPDPVKWGLPAFAIVAAALMLERQDGVARHPLLLLLGEASYAIYLIHPFAIKAMSLLGARFFRDASLAMQALLFVATVLIVGAAGVALHLWVEKPLVGALRRQFVRRRPVPSEPRLSA